MSRRSRNTFTVNKRTRLIARRAVGETRAVVRVRNVGKVDVLLAPGCYIDDAKSAFAYRNYPLLAGASVDLELEQPDDRLYAKRNSRFWADERAAEIEVQIQAYVASSM